VDIVQIAKCSDTEKTYSDNNTANAPEVLMPCVHAVGQKSIALKFSKSRTGSDVRYSCHHNSSPHSRSYCAKQTSLPAPALVPVYQEGHLLFSLTQQTPLCLSSPFMHTTSSYSPPLCFPSVLTLIYSRILQLAAPKNALHVFLSLCTKTVPNYRVVK
jgi:hypothetical protein